MIFEKNKTLSVEELMFFELVTQEEAEKIFSQLVNEKKVKKEFRVIFKNSLSYSIADTEEEIDERLETLKKMGIETEKYFSKKIVYTFLKDTEIEVKNI